jgi:outer membrane protein assembly factor BamB
MNLIVPAALIALSTALAAAEGKIEITGKPHRFLAGDYSRGLIAIVGADGTIEWSRRIQGEIHDAWILPNGHLLYHTGWTRIVELDMKADKEVWSYDAGASNGNAGKEIEVHGFQPLADGGLVLFESGSHRILEIDHDGKLRMQVPLTVKSPSPHRDTRNGRKLANGNYLVAHELDHCVREYDPAGKVVWEHPTNSQVFGVLRLANGNTLINTGNGHRIVEVSPDHTEVWAIEQNELPGITLGWLTQLERLPNGDTIIVNCHAGPTNPQIIEVTPDKRVVWSFRDFEHFGNALPVACLLDAPEGTIR